MSYKTVIKYHEPDPFDWQVNDVIMDAFSAFQTRCYQASPMALCEMYIQLGLMNEMPFQQFVTQLAIDKGRDEACPFTLMADLPYFESTSDFYDAIEEKLKKYKFPLDFPAIEYALVLLAFAKPERRV